LKIDRPILAIIMIGILECACAYYILSNTVLKQVDSKQVEETSYVATEEIAYVEPIAEPIVYDGMTLNELANKLNNSLSSTLSGTGYLFASKSVELGIDPYLAIAIVLHETGCNGSNGCSDLVNYCYNVGGQKGDPGCFGGSYATFSSLEEGINSYLENLYNNYYAVGLTTAETIGPKYAVSETWANTINYYINYIKSN